MEHGLIRGIIRGNGDASRMCSIPVIQRTRRSSSAHVRLKGSAPMLALEDLSACAARPTASTS